MRRCLPALTVVIVLAVPAAARAAEGDIIVQRAPGLDSSERAELRQDAGVKFVDTLPLDHTELVEPSRGKDPNQALAALRADEHVVHAELDQTVRASVSSGFDWSSFWSLVNDSDHDIDAPEAWKKSEGSGATVAVVDTGINASHYDLKNRIVPGWDFVSSDAVPEDGHGHGSHVAGIVAADGTSAAGVVGVAPSANVMPLRALGNDGKGAMSGIIAAFDYAGDHGVRIVNASLGGPNSQFLRDVIAEHPNTLYVVAAGNAGTSADGQFPCALPAANVVCVGASDQNDRPWSHSNYGSAVDLFAPGVDIRSAWKGSATASIDLDGTSMAAPHVAGAAAAALADNPSASTAFLSYSLLSSVDVNPQLSGLAVSGGRLNENGTVDAILGPDPTPAPPATPPPPGDADPDGADPPTAPAATPAPAVVTPAPQPVAPAITALKVRGSLRTKTSRLKVSFTLTAATTMKFSVKRRGSRARLASWSRGGRAGANTVTLTRKLPNKCTLKRGTYTLTAAAGATAKSATIRVP